MDIDRCKLKYLLSYTGPDCPLKIEDVGLVAENLYNRKIFNVLSSYSCWSCEKQAKVGSVGS